MGQLIAKEPDPEQKLAKILKDQQNLRQYFDPHYGDIYFIEGNSSGKQTRLVIKEFFLSADQSSNQKEIKNLEKIIKFQKKCKNIVRLFQYQLLSEGSFCSSVQKLYLVLEHFDRDLYAEIRSKRLQSLYYTEEQIVDFLIAMTESLGNLQEIGVAHQNLRTTTILLDTQNKSYKIFDPRLFPTAPAYVQVMNTILADSGEGRHMKNKHSKKDIGMYYPSPQQLYGLCLRSPEMKYDCFKSDVFTLAVIVVELIALESCYSAYDFEIMMVSRLQLLEIVKAKVGRYSNFLLKLLESMLKEKESERPDFLKLTELLKARKTEMNGGGSDKILENFVICKEHTTPIRDIAQKIKEIDQGSKTPGLQKPICYKEGGQQFYLVNDGKAELDQGSKFDVEKYFSFGPLSKEIMKPNITKARESFHESEKISPLKDYADSGIPNFQAQQRSHADPPFIPIVEGQSEKVYVCEKYEQGTLYEGEKVGNLREGKGRLTYKEGGAYNGDWRAGKMHGFGCLFYPNGKLAYEGAWAEDKFNGKGIVYNEAPQELLESNANYFCNFDNVEDFWIKYEGEFYKDNKQGKGTIYFTNGDIFDGNFQEDLAEGDGVIKFKTGKELIGFWSENKLIKIL